MRYRGRGRPRQGRNQKDFGTPELQFKRQFYSTEEVLDSYLRRRIISPHQHWCGIHFRWLYTLRYGIPNVKAIDTTHLGGRECMADNAEWKLQREAEFATAVQLLNTEKCYDPVLSICVFNEDLIPARYWDRSNSLQILKIEKNTQQFINGMDILESLWFSESTNASESVCNEG